MDLTPSSRLQRALAIRQTLQFTIDSLQEGGRSPQSLHKQASDQLEGDKCPLAINIGQILIETEYEKYKIEKYLNDCTKTRIRRTTKGWDESDIRKYFYHFVFFLFL
jgi:hypothetical protein